MTLRAALDLLDVIDGIVDDTHPEGDGCPLCVALDDLRAVLAETDTSVATRQEAARSMLADMRGEYEG